MRPTTPRAFAGRTRERDLRRVDLGAVREAKYTIAPGGPLRLRLALALWVAWVAVAGIAVAAAPPAEPEPPVESTASERHEAPPSHPPFLRGMTVSCPTWGPIWGAPAMGRTLDDLRTLGVDWISIHPYAQVSQDGTISFRPAAKLDFLERAVRFTHERGQKLFWKPHLAYWGSFEWRGTIAFDTEADWQRFFDGYRAFLVDQAQFAEAQGIDLLAVGLEYEATVHREADWRRVIAAVREVYSGRLTYSANWDGLEAVRFWDAVDWISVQGYYPLAAPNGSDSPPTLDATLDTAAIHAAWDAPLAALRALSERYDRPVLFAEIGYDLAPHAAAEPWRALGRSERTASDSDAATRALRDRLMRVALERLPREDFVVGMFWWKWIPGRDGRRDFPMEHEDARSALRDAWTQTPKRPSR